MVHTSMFGFQFGFRYSNKIGIFGENTRNLKPHTDGEKSENWKCGQQN